MTQAFRNTQCRDQNQPTQAKTCVLWISPNLNHYKEKFLNHLAQHTHLDITVLAGSPIASRGHVPAAEKSKYLQQVHVGADWTTFGWSPSNIIAVLKVVIGKKWDVVLMPLEKKYILLIVLLAVIRRLRRYQLISYNHATVRCSGRRITWLDRWFTRCSFRLYDKIIFYTDKSRDWAIANRILPTKKAFAANNTLDTSLIWKNYAFEIAESSPKTILFIGRLLPAKRLDVLFQYYRELSSQIERLRLIIIGDGPESEFVRQVSDADPNIVWRGGVVDEGRICRDMRKANLVFVPGWSGLSIVHAFSYGKPYCTLVDGTFIHAPEIDYIEDDRNGLLLRGDVKHDIARMHRLLTNDRIYQQACEHAYQTGLRLSIENWRAAVTFAMDA